MFKIDKNDIYLTRGDTAEFRPVIENYEAAENDKVIFAMKKARNNMEPALKIEVAAGENIVFTHENTVSLTSGSYIYDLTLNQANGQISTFASGRFNLLGEVDTDAANN